MADEIQLSKKTIQCVDKYINKLLSTIYDKNNDIEELTVEIKVHLITKIKELLKNNMDEKSALDCVFKEFGNTNSLMNDYNKFYNKIYCNFLIRISILCICLSVFSIISVYLFNYIANDKTFLQYYDYIRYLYKGSLILLGSSWLLFILWELINIIMKKRSKNFIIKCIPINVAMIILLILCEIYSLGVGMNNLHRTIISIFIDLLSVSMPVFYYFEFKNKNLFKIKL